MGVPTPPAVLPTHVTVAVAEPVSQKKVLSTRVPVAVAEPVPQKEGGVGVPTPPAVVCHQGHVDYSTGPAVFEHFSVPVSVPFRRSLVNTSDDQLMTESSKLLAGVSSKSADLHGQSSSSELSSHQISPSARVPAHSSPSTRGDHLTQRMDERLDSHCSAEHPSHLVSDFCLAVGAVAPGSRHKDTTPRKSKVLSLFTDRSLAPNLEAGSKLLSGIKVQLEEIDVSLWQLNKARKWTTPTKNLLFQVQ